MTPEQAEQNVRHIRKPLDDYAQGPQETERWHAAVEEMERRARRLLMSCNPPEGHITLPDGRWVKVLGTLPMTADGCVVGANVTIWHPEHGASDCRYLVDGGTWATPSDPAHPQSGSLYEVAECFSTRELAEAAAKEQR